MFVLIIGIAFTDVPFDLGGGECGSVGATLQDRLPVQ